MEKAKKNGFHLRDIIASQETKNRITEGAKKETDTNIIEKSVFNIQFEIAEQWQQNLQK